MSNRAETRLPVSKDTRIAVNRKLGAGETYDTYLRRMLLFVNRSGNMPPIDELSDAERAWVLNPRDLPVAVEEALAIVNDYAKTRGTTLLP